MAQDQRIHDDIGVLALHLMVLLQSDDARGTILKASPTQINHREG
jgi:hypothetical protein